MKIDVGLFLMLFLLVASCQPERHHVKAGLFSGVLCSEDSIPLRYYFSSDCPDDLCVEHWTPNGFELMAELPQRKGTSDTCLIQVGETSVRGFKFRCMYQFVLK